MKSSLLTKTGIAGSQADGCVDFWKVGNFIHNKAAGQSALGPKFRDAATALLERCDCKYCIKEDLRKAN